MVFYRIIMLKSESGCAIIHHYTVNYHNALIVCTRLFAGFMKSGFSLKKGKTV